jgi:hypothetical protein
VTITREQVADLRPGDVVELRLDDWAKGAAIRGPLRSTEQETLVLPIPGGDGVYWVRGDNGHAFDGAHRTLTVISRAPRPLYVNHHRTEPVPGDVVRDADSGHNAVWLCGDPGDPGRLCWAQSGPPFWVSRDRLPDRLRLLVDGETGEVVP